MNAAADTQSASPVWSAEAGDIPTGKVRYREYVLGSAEAPVTLIEYASLTCPACKQFHDTIFPDLKARYIDTNKVRMIVRPYALNPLDMAGQMLAQCAGETRYYPMVNTFFELQENWVSSSEPLTATMQIAKQAGFTDETFESCLGNEQLLQDLNNVRQQAEDRFGIRATPSFLINGEVFKGRSLKAFEEEIARHLPE